MLRGHGAALLPLRRRAARLWVTLVALVAGTAWLCFSAIVLASPTPLMEFSQPLQQQLIHDPRVCYPFPCCRPQFILLPAALRHVIGGGLAIAVRGWSSDEPRGLKSKL